MTTNKWKNRKNKKRSTATVKRQAKTKRRRKEKEATLRQKRELTRKEESDKKAIWKIQREGEKEINRLIGKHTQSTDSTE